MCRLKRHCQVEHAARRMKERFGVPMTQFLRDSIVHCINSRDCRLVSKQSHRVSVYDVDLFGLPLRVVFDKYRRTIASILTREMDCEPEDTVS